MTVNTNTKKDTPKPGPAVLAAQKHARKIGATRTALEGAEGGLAKCREQLAAIPAAPSAFSALKKKMQDLLAGAIIGDTRPEDLDETKKALDAAKIEATEYTKKVRPRREQISDAIEGLERRCAKFRAELDALDAKTSDVAFAATMEEAESLGAEYARQAAELVATVSRIVGLDGVASTLRPDKGLGLYLTPIVGTGLQFKLPTFRLSSTASTKDLVDWSVRAQGAESRAAETARLEALGVVFPAPLVKQPKARRSGGVPTGYRVRGALLCARCGAKEDPSGAEQTYFEPQELKPLTCSVCGSNFGGRLTPSPAPQSTVTKAPA